MTTSRGYYFFKKTNLSENWSSIVTCTPTGVNLFKNQSNLQKRHNFNLIWTVNPKLKISKNDSDFVSKPYSLNNVLLYLIQVDTGIQQNRLNIILTTIAISGAAHSLFNFKFTLTHQNKIGNVRTSSIKFGCLIPLWKRVRLRVHYKFLSLTITDTSDIFNYTFWNLWT